MSKVRPAGQSWPVGQDDVINMSSSTFLKADDVIKKRSNNGCLDQTVDFNRVDETGLSSTNWSMQQNSEMLDVSVSGLAGVAVLFSQLMLVAASTSADQFDWKSKRPTPVDQCQIVLSVTESS
ncbi:hypothetical protein D4764_18G0007290 [Takifugu flavidus]|uniref:Uncharacterized protein n=1 Tax=Takifugu flavidus TaxID=433684 RepID=A0A5C6NRM5_9TELE|nr:hypothetical protein D4764_18G0007290 [Takifugu flavidus]